jgi:hypothetical protein
MRGEETHESIVRLFADLFLRRWVGIGSVFSSVGKRHHLAQRQLAHRPGTCKEDAYSHRKRNFRKQAIALIDPMMSVMGMLRQQSA